MPMNLIGAGSIDVPCGTFEPVAISRIRLMHTVGASSNSSGHCERTLSTKSFGWPGICAQASVKIPPLSMAMRILSDAILVSSKPEMI